MLRRLPDPDPIIHKSCSDIEHHGTTGRPERHHYDGSPQSETQLQAGLTPSQILKVLPVRKFYRQLVHDLKASWQKTALLAGLFAIGCCFWLPPLIRATAHAFQTSTAKSPADAKSTAGKSAAAKTAAVQESADLPEGRPISWKRFAALLATDPLSQSVAVDAPTRDPFAIDQDQFAPPILFAENEPDTDLIAKGEAAVVVGPPRNLKLKTTVISARRRAALINNQLYEVGQTVTSDTTTYILAEIHPQHVVLACENMTFELQLPGATQKNRIRISPVVAENDTKVVPEPPSSN